MRRRLAEVAEKFWGSPLGAAIFRVRWRRLLAEHRELGVHLVEVTGATHCRMILRCGGIVRVWFRE